MNIWKNGAFKSKVIFLSTYSAAPSSETFFSQQKKRNGESNVNSNSKNESVTLHQDVDASDHHMNRDPPPANMVDSIRPLNSTL